MDTLDEAFNSMGVHTEKIKDTHQRLEEEAKESGIHINEVRQTKEEKALVYEITKADREQAVYEKLIPNAYKDVRFDIQHIKDNIRAQYARSGKLYKIYRFNEYSQICLSILSTIRMNRLPERSYLIGAPNGFGKTSFVNECLITLRKNGYKTAPYISLWELAQIRIDNEKRIMDAGNKFKLENGNVIYSDKDKIPTYTKNPTVITTGYSYSEYINADCLFVYFTDIVSKDIESHTLYQLLAIRGAKGLPTIVMISTSLEPYESDRALKEYVWDEIKDYSDKLGNFDRVYHISCYKRKAFGLDTKDENIETDTGIVLG